MGNRKPPEGYITVPDAAKMCGVCSQTMYDWVLVRNFMPYRRVVGGARSFYYLKKTDVEKYLSDSQKEVPARKKARLYEIVIISLGKLEVLFTTDNLAALSRMYTRMIENQHKLVRIRADGQLLTIDESDKLGLTYHPRTKRRAAL